MEESKKYPPIPSNYVTLAQLQERRRLEKERKQREKEEEEQRKQREKEEQERRRECQEKQGQNENGQRSRTNSVSNNRGPFRRDRRGQSVKNRKTVEVSKPELGEPQFVAAVVVQEAIDDQGQKIDESKKKEKRKRTNKKPRAQKDLIEGKAKPPAENELDENNPVVVTERNGEKEGIRREFRRTGKKLVNGSVWENDQEREEPEEKIPVLVTSRNSEKEGIRSDSGRKGKKMAVNGKVWEKKTPMDRQAEIGLKLEDLSLNNGKEGNEKSMVKMKGDPWMYNQGYGRFNHRNVQKPRDSNLVWVRKEEIYNANAAGIQVSGSKVKVGEGKKNLTRLKQKESNLREY